MIIAGNSTKAMLIWGGISILILVASYFLIVRPILDTTEDATDRAFDRSERLQERGFDQAGGGSSSAEKRLECVQDAGGDPEKLQECASQ